jgi:hypothetical protein
MSIPNHISESLETTFGLKILKFYFFDADTDPGSEIILALDPGYGMDKKPRFVSGIKIPDPQPVC